MAEAGDTAGETAGQKGDGQGWVTKYATCRTGALAEIDEVQRGPGWAYLPIGRMAVLWTQVPDAPGKLTGPV